jgi:hypothetical protein
MSQGRISASLASAVMFPATSAAYARLKTDPEAVKADWQKAATKS